MTACFITSWLFIDSSFCATGNLGLTRNLSASEIYRQVLYLKKMYGDIQSAAYKYSIYGYGEPLLNYKNVMRSLHL